MPIVVRQIWRPVSVTEARYLLAGETCITARWVGYSNFVLHPDDRFPVRRGDVVGLYYPMYNPIPWSSVPCRPGEPNEFLFREGGEEGLGGRVRKSGGGKRWRGGEDMEEEEEEWLVSFERGDKDLRPCRRYSINATIMDDQGVDLSVKLCFRYQIAIIQ